MSSGGDERNQEGKGFQELLQEEAREEKPLWDEERSEKESGGTRHVLSFRVGEDCFSVAGELVREILGEQKSTPLPGTPGYIRGVAVLRRQVVALLSLREFLKIPGEEEEAERSRTMIVEAGGFTVGLIVDEVLGLGEWPESMLDPEKVPQNLRASTARYARGVQLFGERLHIFLELSELLEDAAVR